MGERFDLLVQPIRRHGLQDEAQRLGFPAVDLSALGLPSEADYLAAYCRRTGRAGLDQWEFYVVFAMFRIAAILAGVYKRGLDGNGADASAIERGSIYRNIAAQARHFAEQH